MLTLMTVRLYQKGLQTYHKETRLLQTLHETAKQNSFIAQRSSISHNSCELFSNGSAAPAGGGNGATWQSKSIDVDLVQPLLADQGADMHSGAVHTNAKNNISKSAASGAGGVGPLHALSRSFSRTGQSLKKRHLSSLAGFNQNGRNDDFYHLFQGESLDLAEPVVSTALVDTDFDKEGNNAEPDYDDLNEYRGPDINIQDNIPADLAAAATGTSRITDAAGSELAAGVSEQINSHQQQQQQQQQRGDYADDTSSASDQLTRDQGHYDDTRKLLSRDHHASAQPSDVVMTVQNPHPGIVMMRLIENIMAAVACSI
eukprot:jgi/Chrzof1/7748/Cz02g35100.t1